MDSENDSDEDLQASKKNRKYCGRREFKKGTKLHFKSPTAERRHVLCVGVGGDRTHAGPLQKSGAEIVTESQA